MKHRGRCALDEGEENAMKHGKRREMGVRLTALGLAAALVVGGASALRRPVHAGQSAGSFVEEKT